MCAGGMMSPMGNGGGAVEADESYIGRLHLRGPNGAHDEFILAATAQNLRKMAKLIPMQTPKPACGRQSARPRRRWRQIH